MTYKHGDWYCNPANEAEAKEVIERAVASGARNIYERKGSSSRIPYGVINGCLDCRVMEGAEYSIEQVRKLFPLPGDQITKQWQGPQDGMPPVGTICKGLYRGKWLQCEVLKHKVNNIGINVAACDFGIDLAWTGQFQPLRTEQERWVDAAAVFVHKHSTLTPEHSKQAAYTIYKALTSGELKAPEIES